jgi:uncharacterized phage protein gp47/JayE
MPFEIPTLKALAERAARSFRANLKGSDAFLWPNNVAVSAKVMAGAVWEAFSFLDYISRQIFVLSAEGPWIDRHAAEYGMARLPATFAAGKATISGDPSVAVPAGIVLERADGIQYETTASGVTSGLGTVDLPVRALNPGKTGNAAAGVGLALTVPISRLDTAAEVAAGGIGAGADLESDESLRQRVWFRKKLPPHGGARHDYVAWAREINGVTRVFVDPVTAANERVSVGVWFLMDGTYPNGIPQAADVATVAAYIDTVRPAGALVEVAAPIPVALDVTIAGLAPDTTEVRNAIHAELIDLLERGARVSTLTEPYTLYRSKIVEAISIATGEDHHSLTVPAADVTYALGQIPVLGTISYA